MLLFMTLLSSYILKDFLTEPPFNGDVSLISSIDWQVKNEEMPQSGAPEKFGAKGQREVEGTILVEKRRLIANFSVRENFY